MAKDNTKELGRVVHIDEGKIRGHLDEMVRSTVEQTLNDLLDADAERLCNAPKYARSPERVDSRAGHYERKLLTKAGEVRLKVPKLRETIFETAIIDRYRRRESSVEEAMIEMYLAGVSVRRVESITEALWGSKVSPGTVSKLNKRIYAHIEAWRTRPIEGSYAYVYLDGVVLKRSWGGEVRNISVLVAIGVDQDGYRSILGVAEGAKEDKAGWSSFLRYLKERGLTDVRLIISDACLGLVESMGDFYPEAQWQRCTVHFYRNVFSRVPRDKVSEVSRMLKAIHSQEDLAAARDKAQAVVEKLRGMKLRSAADLVERWWSKHSPITTSLANTGGASAPIIPWSELYERYEDAPGWWEPSRTVKAPSCWWRQD